MVIAIRSAPTKIGRGHSRRLAQGGGRVGAGRPRSSVPPPSGGTQRRGTAREAPRKAGRGQPRKTIVVLGAGPRGEHQKLLGEVLRAQDLAFEGENPDERVYETL